MMMIIVMLYNCFEFHRFGVIERTPVFWLSCASAKSMEVQNNIILEMKKMCVFDVMFICVYIFCKIIRKVLNITGSIS